MSNDVTRTGKRRGARMYRSADEYRRNMVLFAKAMPVARMLARFGNDDEIVADQGGWRFSQATLAEVARAYERVTELLLDGAVERDLNTALSLAPEGRPDRLRTQRSATRLVLAVDNTK